jgi:hypothetical protein
MHIVQDSTEDARSHAFALVRMLISRDCARASTFEMLLSAMRLYPSHKYENLLPVLFHVV